MMKLKVIHYYIACTCNLFKNTSTPTWFNGEKTYAIGINT